PACEPFDLVSIDTVLGLGRYGSTKDMFHFVMDHATRYAWVFPSTSTSTEAYLSVIKQMQKIGPVKQILSDRAAAFLSNRYKKYLEDHDIKRLLTSTQNPQCNGLNERTNQEIMKRLRCKINDPDIRNKVWTKLIEDAAKEYNNTPHEVTGFTPTFLMYGLVPYGQFRMESDMTMEEARRIAVNNSSKYHQKNQIHYDKRFQRPNFKVGDKVLVEVAWHPNNGKLTAVMEGPYTILRELPPVNYEIDRPNQPARRTTEIIHSNKLRLYHSPGDFQLEVG
ncbi:integrase catalytic domain-containing protein, partial [Clostridioides difficile]|uniref:integrase catalytic domain-containing protein n=1 Tax=Clostridioides difficile TaxID=1496 RepID=UPI0010348123